MVAKRGMQFLAGTVSSIELASVAFGNDRFVAVGSGGTIFTSDNAFYVDTPLYAPPMPDLTGWSSSDLRALSRLVPRGLS